MDRAVPAAAGIDFSGRRTAEDDLALAMASSTCRPTELGLRINEAELAGRRVAIG
ncbi:MAG: hypothetical protein ACREE2_17595 [Stellaceae bacterium]